MHYYQFNIGDYAAHTKGLSLLEDLAYRRLLDEYYLAERPFNGCSTDVARMIGMAQYLGEVEYILAKYFSKDGEFWRHIKIDKAIVEYKDKQEKAQKAGKASANARKQPKYNGRSTDVQPTINQEPLTNNHKPINNTPSDEVVPESKKMAVIVNEDDLRLARFFYQKVLIVQPKAKEPNFDKWANTIRLIREQDSRTHKQIQDVFLWANKDPFWKANIMSPEALRKQLDKLEVQMQNRPTGALNGGSLADRMAAETYRHLLPQEGSFNDEPKLIG